MSRVVGKIKPVELAKLARTPGMHGDGGGLWLSVGAPPSTAVSWVWRYMIAGRARSLGLGPYPEITLGEARERALEARRQKAHGEDPIEVKRAEEAKKRVMAAKAMTFKEAAEAFIRDHQAAWKPGSKTEAQWKSSLQDYVYPLIGSLPVGEIDTGLVVKVLKQDVEGDDGEIKALWFSRTETADRVRSRISQVLDWAETNGYRPEGKNPARWKGHIANLLPPRAKIAPVQGHASLPVKDVPAFMALLRYRKEPSARALELTILTGSRTNELIAAKWEEFDLDDGVWIVPGGRTGRMKAWQALEHRVPLSKRAVEVIRELKPEVPGEVYVFPGMKPGRPLSNMAMLKLLARMGRGDLTTHGFRSSFRNWAGETGVARDLAEACLAHTITNKAEAAYFTSDVLERRRPVMQAWADYCASTPDATKVVPIRRAGAA